MKILHGKVDYCRFIVRYENLIIAFIVEHEIIVELTGTPLECPRF